MGQRGETYTTSHNGRTRPWRFVVLTTCTLVLVAGVMLACCPAGASAVEASTDSRFETASFQETPLYQDMLELQQGILVRYRQTIRFACLLALNPDSLPAEATIDPSMVQLIGADVFFSVQPIPDSVFARMEGVTYPDDCPVARDELRYLRLLHVDAEGRVKVGEMVVNEAIADDVLDIFRQLFDAGYAIERVRLADDYGGDDETSMEDDNTSAFNCRPIEGSGEQSRHSYGMAVDINTLYNPYYADWSDTVLPVTAGEYLDRSNVGPYTIEDGDLCCQLFAAYGFEWGGDWYSPKDYQHFEK